MKHRQLYNVSIYAGEGWITVSGQTWGAIFKGTDVWHRVEITWKQLGMELSWEQIEELRNEKLLARANEAVKKARTSGQQFHWATRPSELDPPRS